MGVGSILKQVAMPALLHLLLAVMLTGVVPVLIYALTNPRQ